MKNIVLIGMPGSGKSTVGVLLAKMTGRMFLDSDLLIQQAEGKRLFEIIRDNGGDYFKEAENRVNSAIDVNNTVIATGGSVVYCDEAMEHLRSIGTVVYLKVACDGIVRRISDLPTRGVLIGEGCTMEDLYNERAALYEKYADITVECGGDDVSENARRITEAISKIQK